MLHGWDYGSGYGVSAHMITWLTYLPAFLRQGRCVMCFCILGPVMCANGLLAQAIEFMRDRGAIEVPAQLRDQFMWDQAWVELMERWT